MAKVGRKKYPEALVPITVSIGKDMEQTTRVVAAHQGISRSEFVRRALKAYLGDNQQWSTYTHVTNLQSSTREA